MVEKEMVGDEQHDLLRLRDEACNFLDYPNLVRDSSSGNSTVKNQTAGCDPVRVEVAVNDVQLLNQRDPLASIDVPLALALAEHDEQNRCKVWKNFCYDNVTIILPWFHRTPHNRALRRLTNLRRTIHTLKQLATRVLDHW